MALAENVAAGNESNIALATAGLGTVARLEGRFADARSFFERALDVSRRIEDMRCISISLNCLADIYLHEGNSDAACLCLEEALAIYRELGQSEAECNNLNILGRIMLEAGRDAEAYDYYSRALDIARSQENKINTIEALIGFSAMACKAGNDELSATFSGAAERLRDSIDYKLEPSEEAFRRTYADRVKAHLAEHVFDAASNIGRTLALSQVLNMTGNDIEDLTLPVIGADTQISIETHRRSTIIIEES
jgi:tetratricopeptide (TPR) repeat protein